ncbi:SOS response-associated peptidase family protein [Psychroserpens mesophilus]|uniref:SOS response-associated peptidase family protein n=1 Tax=Psychroserpens mesophilus TaxID=325473 RepID=UPI00058B0832|nr:SOS response-associated peptidase family protein [Psychroserpens mesophilus]
MFYKLSDTSNLNAIENDFDAKFRFPKLYEPRAIIDGTVESNLTILTADNPKIIDYAIWGILPEDYDDDWDRFQNITNTLNTNVNELDSDEIMYSEAFSRRRCLIIVNGFFTARIYNGKLLPFHIHLRDHKPFCIAGIYNTLNDGFLTCSLLVVNFSSSLNEIPHLGKKRPLTFKKSDYNNWLSQGKSNAELVKLIQNHDAPDFMSHPIKEEFYERNHVFEKILDHDNYQSIGEHSHLQ